MSSGSNHPGSDQNRFVRPVSGGIYGASPQSNFQTPGMYPTSQAEWTHPAVLSRPRSVHTYPPAVSSGPGQLMSAPVFVPVVGAASYGPIYNPGLDPRTMRPSGAQSDPAYLHRPGRHSLGNPETTIFDGQVYPGPGRPEVDPRSSLAADRYSIAGHVSESPLPSDYPAPRGQDKDGAQTQRRQSSRDEFEGPRQYLDKPSAEAIAAQEKPLPLLPTHLEVQEQDQILADVNERLSQCAFDFIARYQFPVPVEPDKRRLRVPADREWNEYVSLLKRLTTKRRIPARVLHNNQIKQFVTVLENSLEMRHAAMHASRPPKDDRNVLQLISAGLQVAKILKDPAAMEYLDRLYRKTETLIRKRSTETTSDLTA